MAATRALLAGGGSAGHTSPLIATADALRRLRPDSEIVCLGTSRGLETRVIPEAGYRLELIPPVPFPRRPGADLARVPGRLLGATRRTMDVMRRFEPDVVVGFGGYVSMPAYLAARRLRLPILIHEQNALPGLANRFGAMTCTKHVATSFPGTRLPHAVLTGLPIRRSISTLDRHAQRVEACRHYGLDPERTTLLVTGGSQGAARINTAISTAAAAFAQAGLQVLHVCGPARAGLVTGVEIDLSSDAPVQLNDGYVLVPFVDRMERAYSVADAMVGRAGANTVTEGGVVGLPAVFVPFPIGNGEQRRNAAAMVESGGAVLVDDAEFTPDYVQMQLIPLLLDADRLAAMARGARSSTPHDADERVAMMTLDLARDSVRG